MAEMKVNPPQTFEVFPRLPIELRLVIWKHAAHRTSRILQAFYNHQNKLWQISHDSISPKSVSNVCREARSAYDLLLGAYILPQKDVVLIADPNFILRGPQKTFLKQGETLAHLALTNDIWLGLRQIYHGFPAVSLSPAGVARKLAKLETFTLAAAEEEHRPYELEADEFDDLWTEETSGEWLDDGDCERAQRHSIAMIELENESPVALHADANGQVPIEVMADRFLSGLEAITMADLQEEYHPMRTGLLKLRAMNDDPEFYENPSTSQLLLYGDFHQEMSDHKAWKRPKLYARYIESEYTEFGDDIDHGLTDGEESEDFEWGEEGDEDDE